MYLFFTNATPMTTIIMDASISEIRVEGKEIHFIHKATHESSGIYMVPPPRIVKFEDEEEAQEQYAEMMREIRVSESGNVLSTAKYA